MNAFLAPLIGVLLLLSVALAAEKDVTKLQIGVKFRPPTCDKKAHNGDSVKVHYKGTLTNGEKFDSSYDRDEPFEFTLGTGSVIKGWDLGILGMCIGEKRKLKIPSDLGYGDEGSPPTIPGKATLIFETELVDIVEKVESDEPDFGGDEYSEEGAEGENFDDGSFTAGNFDEGDLDVADAEV